MAPAAVGAPAPLTAEQQKALAGLHTAAQQFEGIFIGMLFKEMRKDESDISLSGPKSPTEKIFSEMLDDRRAQDLAKTGSFGLAKILEDQLRAAVLANASREAKAPLEGLSR